MSATEQFSLCWDNYHKNMSSGMHSLLESEDLVDVTLAVEGKYLKAHKMVLSVCSPYFRNLFRTTPCQHPIVFMKDVGYDALCDLLQFMYRGEVQVNQENLSTFIKTAEALQIKGLTGDSPPSENDTESHKSDTITKKQFEAAVKQVKTVKKTPGPAPKRPRLLSTPEKVTVVGKPEPPSQDQVQYKLEPYEGQSEQSTSMQKDETCEEVFDDEDDAHADDTEDYGLLETGTEPRAGTSGDCSEGQDRLDKSSSFSEPPKPPSPQSSTKYNSDHTDDDDDDEMLSLNSEAFTNLDPSSFSYQSVLLNDEITEMLETYLVQGIPQMKRRELFSKYAPAENCSALKPAELNENVKRFANRRQLMVDNLLKDCQSILASGITAVGISLNIFLEEASYSKEVYTNLTDAVQIFAGVFYKLTAIRRIHMQQHVRITFNRNQKQVAYTPGDKLFFGIVKVMHAGTNHGTIPHSQRRALSKPPYTPKRDYREKQQQMQASPVQPALMELVKQQQQMLQSMQSANQGLMFGAQQQQVEAGGSQQQQQQFGWMNQTPQQQQQRQTYFRRRNRDTKKKGNYTKFNPWANN